MKVFICVFIGKMISTNKPNLIIRKLIFCYKCIITFVLQYCIEYINDIFLQNFSSVRWKKKGGRQDGSYFCFKAAGNVDYHLK